MDTGCVGTEERSDEVANDNSPIGLQGSNRPIDSSVFWISMAVIVNVRVRNQGRDWSFKRRQERPCFVT